MVERLFPGTLTKAHPNLVSHNVPGVIIHSNIQTSAIYVLDSIHDLNPSNLGREVALPLPEPVRIQSFD